MPPRSAPVKFDNFHQIGGIQTGTLDYPNLGGPGVRVAHVNTGSPLRFTIALERGGDIVHAFHGQHSIAYLSPVGLAPANHAFHHGADWLYGWAGGLLTTCGPLNIGWPREVDGVQHSLHGHYSNMPAVVTALDNPDPRRGKLDFGIAMTIRDPRMFGPVVEIQRTFRCTLGQPVIHLTDVVTNLGNTRVPHHWLYHVNFGFPFLDRGARFIYAGPSEYWEMGTGSEARKPTRELINRIKTVTDPLPNHTMTGEHGLIVTAKTDRKGLCHVGMVNEALALGVELEYPSKALPRVANWQHFGPAGSYVTGVEPFSGSLLGADKDKFPGANQYMQPNETRRYDMTIRVHGDAKSVKAFAAKDGPVTVG